MGGTLAALTRTESSGFPLTTSITLNELEIQLSEDRFQAIAPDAALQHLNSVSLPMELAKRWCQGQQIVITEDLVGNLRIYDEDNRFLGIAQSQDGIIIPQMVFEPIS